MSKPITEEELSELSIIYNANYDHAITPTECIEDFFIDEDDARMLEKVPVLIAEVRRLRKWVEGEASAECQYSHLEENYRQQACRGMCLSCEARALLKGES